MLVAKSEYRAGGRLGGSNEAREREGLAQLLASAHEITSNPGLTVREEK
jgi:hypothetical protein